jgi:hypothetical protein
VTNEGRRKKKIIKYVFEINWPLAEAKTVWLGRTRAEAHWHSSEHKRLSTTHTLNQTHRHTHRITWHTRPALTCNTQKRFFQCFNPQKIVRSQKKHTQMSFWICLSNPKQIRSAVGPIRRLMLVQCRHRHNSDQPSANNKKKKSNFSVIFFSSLISIIKVVSVRVTLSTMPFVVNWNQKDPKLFFLSSRNFCGRKEKHGTTQIT